MKNGLELVSLAVTQTNIC